MKKILYIILLLVFMVTMIILGNKYLIRNDKTMDINGAENLDNLDVNSYDVKALSIGVDKDVLKTVPLSTSNYDDFDSYYLTKETKYYKRTITNSTTSKGETYSTIDYVAINEKTLIKLLKENKSGITTYLWIKNNKTCLDILISFE